MSDFTGFFLAIAIIVSVALGATAYKDTHPSDQPVMCQEDEVIVGVGDFSNGTWQGYRCENREEVN